MAKRPITTVVTVSHLGIYDAKRKVWYYASWVKENKGKKVYVLSDLFNDIAVHVFNAETDEYIGIATTKAHKPVIVNRKPLPSLLLFCK